MLAVRHKLWELKLHFDFFFSVFGQKHTGPRELKSIRISQCYDS